MASTEATVRAAILAGLRAVAVDDLGFARTNGNIQAYLLEFAGRLEKDKVDYLMAYVDGSTSKQLRCWAVQVTGDDDLFSSTGNITERYYSILVRGYYWPEEVNTAIDHARKVRSAIKGLTTNLSSTVDAIEDIFQRDPQIVSAPDALPGAAEMCVIDLELRARKRPADF